MRIATWNINSVRRRMSLVVDWLAANKPDVLCLQETKVPDGEFPAAAFIDAGYHVAFRGMKGYNGVATLTRREPESVFYGFCAGPDSEDVRILETVVDGIPIVKTYVRSETKSAPISTSSSWNGFTAYAGISASAS